MRRRFDLAEKWQAEVTETKAYDHPHSTPLWPWLMYTLGAESGRLLYACQQLPSPQRRSPMLELIRWAEELGISRPVRRMIFELSIPRGWTHYQLTIAPRPRSKKSMTTEALKQFKLSKSITENRRIAAEILFRHEQGMSVLDAAAAIAEDGLFPGRDQDALVKRWHHWRKWAQGFGSNYYLTVSKIDGATHCHVTIVPDTALSFIRDTRPLPSAGGGRPKSRANRN